jgi:hypothetical protein
MSGHTATDKKSMTVIHEEDYEDSQLAISQLISGNSSLGITANARLKSKQAELL